MLWISPHQRKSSYSDPLIHPCQKLWTEVIVEISWKNTFHNIFRVSCGMIENTIRIEKFLKVRELEQIKVWKYRVSDLKMFISHVLLNGSVPFLYTFNALGTHIIPCEYHHIKGNHRNFDRFSPMSKSLDGVRWNFRKKHFSQLF